MRFQYQPHGVCSLRFLFELEDGVVHNIQFIGGCSGNTQGVSILAEGMNVDEVIGKLRGIQCGSKGTSCPDQLARALTLAREKLAEKEA